MRVVSIRECLTVVPKDAAQPEGRTSEAILTDLRDGFRASRRKPSHRRGYVLNALAFSTLLSSQGAGAHLQRALVRLQGNYSNLPDGSPVVNQVPENFSSQVGGPSAQRRRPDTLPWSREARQLELSGGSRGGRSAVWRSVPRRARRTLGMDGALVKSFGDVGAGQRWTST